MMSGSSLQQMLCDSLHSISAYAVLCQRGPPHPHAEVALRQTHDALWKGTSIRTAGRLQLLEGHCRSHGAPHLAGVFRPIACTRTSSNHIPLPISTCSGMQTGLLLFRHVHLTSYDELQPAQPGQLVKKRWETINTQPQLGWSTFHGQSLPQPLLSS